MLTTVASAPAFARQQLLPACPPCRHLPVPCTLQAPGVLQSCERVALQIDTVAAAAVPLRGSSGQHMDWAPGR